MIPTSNKPRTGRTLKGRVGLWTKRRYRPGTLSLREIRKHQTSTNLLIPKLSFQRLVKEILTKECMMDSHLGHVMKIQSTAMLALQTAVEDYCVELFSMSQMAAIHGKRVTVEPKDLELVRSFRGYDRFFHKPS